MASIKVRGVQQSVAKKISGRRTDSVFERYNIIDKADLDQPLGSSTRTKSSMPMRFSPTLGRVRADRGDQLNDRIKSISKPHLEHPFFDQSVVGSSRDCRNSVAVEDKAFTPTENW